MYADSKTHKIQLMYLKNSLIFKYITRCLISFVCFFFLSTSHFVHYKSSNCPSSLHSFSNSKVRYEYLRFKNYWGQNLLIPSVPQGRTPEAVQQGTPLSAVANNNLRLFPHVHFQFFSVVFLSPDALWPSSLFFSWNLDTKHQNQYKTQQEDIYISVSISLYFIQDHISLNLFRSL